MSGANFLPAFGHWGAYQDFRFACFKARMRQFSAGNPMPIIININLLLYIVSFWKKLLLFSFIFGAPNYFCFFLKLPFFYSKTVMASVYDKSLAIEKFIFQTKVSKKGIWKIFSFFVLGWRLRSPSEDIPLSPTASFNSFCKILKCICLEEKKINKSRLRNLKLYVLFYIFRGGIL